MWVPNNLRSIIDFYLTSCFSESFPLLVPACQPIILGLLPKFAAPLTIMHFAAIFCAFIAVIFFTCQRIKEGFSTLKLLGKKIFLNYLAEIRVSRGIGGCTERAKKCQSPGPGPFFRNSFNCCRITLQTYASIPNCHYRCVGSCGEG